MATRSAVLAIINPLSGTTSVEQKKQLQDAFMRRAEALGYAPEAVMTTHPGHATELATAAVERGINRVLAIGGDGTINETAQALRRSATALGIIPIGSGNGLARHLGVPLNPAKAIERALTGRPVVIDSGEINEHPFFVRQAWASMLLWRMRLRKNQFVVYPPISALRFRRSGITNHNGIPLRASRKSYFQSRLPMPVSLAMMPG